MRILRTVIGVLSLSLLTGADASAQASSAPSHPWAAFFGCWVPLEGERSLALTCVVPVDGAPLEVEQLTVIAGNIVRAVSIHADGERRAIDAAGCEGGESAAFSVDGTRVYLRGSAKCSDGKEQFTTGMFSITPEGDFLQVASVRVGEQRTLTTQRQGLLRWDEIPEVLESRLAPYVTIAVGARTDAARPLNFNTIEESLLHADAMVVEAWMAETGAVDADFRVTRRELNRLVAMNAPERIIDMSVVLANPKQFAPRVERVANVDGARDAGTAHRSWLGSDPRFDSFCNQLQMGMMNWRNTFPFWATMLYPGMGMSYYAWFPECAGGGFYSRMAFGPYGYGRWYGGPFVGVPSNVTVTTTTRRPPGTVTKGSGYSNTRESTGAPARPRSSGSPGTVTARGSSASSSSGGSSSSSSSSGTRSAGSNGSGRTAQPRNP